MVRSPKKSNLSSFLEQHKAARPPHVAEQLAERRLIHIHFPRLQRRTTNLSAKQNAKTVVKTKGAALISLNE